jgi:hypothetical protein
VLALNSAATEQLATTRNCVGGATRDLRSINDAVMRPTDMGDDLLNAVASSSQAG